MAIIYWPRPEEAWKNCSVTTFINILCIVLFILKPCVAFYTSSPIYFGQAHWQYKKMPCYKTCTMCTPINNLIYITSINNCGNPLGKCEVLYYWSCHRMLSIQAFSQDLKSKSPNCALGSPQVKSFIKQHVKRKQ